MSRKVNLQKYNSKKLEWFRDARWFILATVIIFVLFRFVIGFSIINGDSMAPTLQDGDAVLYLRIVPKYEVGDIVAFRVPSGDYYVKRIVALSGDSVDIRHDNAFINGMQDAYSLADGNTGRLEGTILYPYTVSDGFCFTLGDNRQESVDSRFYGEVASRRIKGKIFLKITFIG